MGRRIILFLIGVNLVASGCYRNYFYVQQRWIDRNHLASIQVQTPDPRQEDPLVGQQLIVSWDFPRSVFEEQLTLVVTVILWDGTEDKVCFPIQRRKGWEELFFPHKKRNSSKKILTYKAEAISRQGKVVGFWEHQFWTELIEVHTDL